VTTAAGTSSKNNIFAADNRAGGGLIAYPATLLNLSGGVSASTGVPTSAGKPRGRQSIVVAASQVQAATSDLPTGLTNAIALAGGDEHGLALKSDDSLVAWGDNRYGQGVVPTGISNVAAIAAGAYHNLVLKTDGALVAWGDNSAGQGVVPTGLTDVVAIAAGGYHNLALKADSTVVAWGSNDGGQSSVPTGLTGVIAIAAGADHSLALKADGTLVAWGNNSYGQLNIPAGLVNVTAIVAGQYHSMALRMDGTVVAWGRNDFGQTAVPSDLGHVTAIAANYYHSLALRADGVVVTWGGNNNEQRNLPANAGGVVAIAAGGQHTLLIQASDTTPPTTEISSTDAEANSTSAQFWFTGEDDVMLPSGLTFQCALDGSAFAPCTNPQRYSDLAAGSHTFAVKAVDGAGNVADNAATHTWTIAPPAPVLGVDSPVIPDAGGQRLVMAAQRSNTLLDFGIATINLASTVRWVTLYNTGNANLTISNVAISGAQAGDFTVSTPPPATLAPNSSAQLAITFAPTAAGLREATLTITSNADPYSRALQGTGTADPYPLLAVPDTTIKVTNNRFSVPVELATNGANLAAVGFVLNYDATCLIFDANDSNNDDTPDGITGLPIGFASSISHRTTDTGGALEIALLDDTQPIATLSNGALLMLTFDVKPDCVSTDGSVSLGTVTFAATPAVSFGAPNAVDVAGAASGAAIPLRFNAAPTALALSNDELSENTPAGATIGTISVTDPDGEDTHSYSLVAGEGDTDNAAFVIEGTTLKTAIALNYEPKPEYRVRVRVTDNGGLTYEQAFVIKTIDLSEAPTGIATTDGPTSDGNPATVDIKENQPTDTLVAKLDPANPDTNNSYTYALVAGAGDTDNGSFAIVDNQLRSAASFDYESKASYAIRLQITDKLGRSVQQPFTVLIGNVDEAVSAVDDTIDPRARIFLGGESSIIDVLANDVTGSGALSIASITQPANGGGSVTNNTTNVSYTAPQANGSTTFTYQATNGSTTSNNATVSLSYVANQTRGDCNGNGNVAAADFIAIVLEIFDANDIPYNGGPAWWLTHTGDYAGSPLGCDANNSRNGANNSSDSITAADITCSVLIFFGHACGTGLQAASADQAALSVAAVANGGQTTIPVTLKSGGHAVAAAAFALELGDSAFDATDANGDGLPDAVTLNVPAGVTKSVVWNAAAKRLEVALYGVNLPLPTLSDGVLATVTVNGNVTPALTQLSLSDANGNDLLAPTRTGLFLPLVAR
jgi:hypothetical protein